MESKVLKMPQNMLKYYKWGPKHPKIILFDFESKILKKL